MLRYLYITDNGSILIIGNNENVVKKTYTEVYLTPEHAKKQGILLLTFNGQCLTHKKHGRIMNECINNVRKITNKIKNAPAIAFNSQIQRILKS